MTIALDVETTASHSPTTAASHRAAARVAAVAGIAFPVLVLVFNALVGSAPAFDASPAEIADHIADKRGILIAQVVQFAVAFPCLLVFAAGFYGVLRRRAGDDLDLLWARTGLIGAVIVAPLFTATVASRVVLLARHDSLLATPDTTTLLWGLEGATLALTTLALGVATLGFARAGARTGALPAWFRHVGPVGLVASIVAAGAAVALVGGNEAGMGVGLVAFLSWMLLLVVASVRMLRTA